MLHTSHTDNTSKYLQIEITYIRCVTKKIYSGTNFT